MKLVNNLSLAKTNYLRSFISRLSGVSFRTPKYAIITTVVMTLALLAAANIYRERETARAAKAAKEQTQSQLANLNKTNAIIRHNTETLRQNKEVIGRTAQEKLNLVRPNEILLVVK